MNRSVSEVCTALLIASLGGCEHHESQSLQIAPVSRAPDGFATAAVPLDTMPKSLPVENAREDNSTWATPSPQSSSQGSSQSSSPGSSIEATNGPVGEVMVSVHVDAGTTVAMGQALSALRPQLRLCYNRALKLNPTLAGMLLFEVTGDGAGTAKEVRMLLRRGLTDGVDQCALGVVKRIRRLPPTLSSFQCRLEFRLP